MPPITLDGSSGITTPMYGGSITANAVTPSVNMKNRIINGAMVIDQRNAGASGSTSNVYTVDRWRFNNSVASKLTYQQNAGSVTPPAGFTNYLGLTSSSSYAISSSDYFGVNQLIEGYNIADLGWGSANAKTVTLSFWVRSSLTGTFGGAIRTGDSANYSYPFSYSISSANTWEQKSVTIVGPTAGTWNTTNGQGLDVWFGLGTGSTYSGTAGAWVAANYVSANGATSVVGTNGATFYITGVQFEVGSTATSFDYRPYGTELALCQRYFEKSYDTTVAPATNTTTNAVYNYGSTDQYSSLVASVPFRVEKRAAPTMTAYQTGGTSGSWAYGRSGATGTATANFYDTGTTRFTQYMTIGASAYASANCIGHWTASAEL